MALASLPPEAQREPSGDMVTVLRYPVWPMWLVLSLQLVRFHTLTYLSHPQLTMMGFWLLGEKRTQDTQSPWPSSWMVYLHWASVFHSLVVLPAERSQRRRVLSHDPERAKWPSEESHGDWV